MLNGLDLFSGIGGLALALQPWARPIAYCENDRHAQAVLLSRMRDGRLPSAPIWDDVRTLNGSDIRGPVDIIAAGFPCQDLSFAGAGAGLAGERSGLFFEIIRLSRDLRPRFIFLENVPALSVRGLEHVCLELTSLGYDCRWTIVSAAELGAPHIRERWFLLAHSNGVAKDLRQTKERLADLQLARAGALQLVAGSTDADRDWWSTEPAVQRVADGVPFRLDRLRRIGNSVVPAQAREAFKRLSGING